MAAFGQAPTLSVEDEKAKLAFLQKQQSGVSALRPFELQGVKCTSGLTGEKWKGGDPQVASDVQRAWLYAKDASLANFVKGKTDQKLKEDNELSLNIGDGDRAKNFVLSDEPAFYRHIRCPITNIKNNVITKK